MKTPGLDSGLSSCLCLRSFLEWFGTAFDSIDFAYGMGWLLFSMCPESISVFSSKIHGLI